MILRSRAAKPVYLTTADNEHLSSISARTAFYGTLGSAATFNGNDVITGNGHSTLSINDSGLGDVREVNFSHVTGIAELNFFSSQSSIIDVSALVGLKSVNIETATTSKITVGDKTDLNIATGDSAYVYGGRDVVVSVADSGFAAIYGGDATRSVTLSGGQNSGIVDANFMTGDPNSIREVTLAHTATNSAVSLSSSALGKVNLTDFHGGAEIDSAGVDRPLTLTLNGVGPGFSEGSGAVFSDPTTTSVKLHTVHEDSGIYLQFAAAQSLSIDLDASLTLTTLYAPSVHASTIKGSGNLTGRLDQLGEGTINASRASGDMDLVLGSGQNFKGGSGDDIITMVGDQIHSTLSLGRGSAFVSLGETIVNLTVGDDGNTIRANGGLNSFIDSTPANATSVSTTNLSVIKGLDQGDLIVFEHVGVSAVVDASDNLAGVSGHVEFAHGSFNAAAETFTLNANGHDTLMTYGITDYFVSIVLVGVDQDTLPSNLDHGQLYLS